MTGIRRHIFLALFAGIALVLLACWGLYHHTQAILSHQLAHLAEQSLPSDGPTPSLIIQGTDATGWPFGAWRRLHGVTFHTHLNGADIAGATPTLILGGNWLDWARALTTQDKLPLHMPESTILRLVRNGESLTLRLQATRLRISRGSTTCPPSAVTCPAGGTMPLYRARFHLAMLDIASSRLPYGVTLHYPAGTLRFAPQSLTLHDPALQDRSLLSAVITAEELSVPMALLRDFRIMQFRSTFALLPAPVTGTASPPLPAAPPPLVLPVRGHGAGPHPAASSWTPIPLRLRVHELSATIHPLAPEEQGPPPPHLSLGGELYVPAFSGTVSATLTNWQTPLHLLLQSLWFQRTMPAATRAFLQELMNSPKMDTLSTRPLTVSIPLEHGFPPGLSPERLRTLYDRLHQLLPPAP